MWIMGWSGQLSAWAWRKHVKILRSKRWKKIKIKISVNTFNWGPCVVRFKIQDDFRKVLLDEAKKTEQDFSDRLAGQIAKERGYSDKQRDIIIPYLSPYLGMYDECISKISK